VTYNGTFLRNAMAWSTEIPLFSCLVSSVLLVPSLAFLSYTISGIITF